jgi:hypothetical protein
MDRPGPDGIFELPQVQQRLFCLSLVCLRAFRRIRSPSPAQSAIGAAGDASTVLGPSECSVFVGLAAVTTIFLDDKSPICLIGVVLTEQSDKWQGGSALHECRVAWKGYAPAVRADGIDEEVMPLRMTNATVSA